MNSDFHITLLRTPIVSAAGALAFSSIVPPITLAILSSNLRAAGFNVSNIDSVGEDIDHIAPVPRNPNLNYQGLSIEEIVKKIPENTNLLAVSCMFSNEWPFSRDVIKSIKKAKPNLSIIAGGEHVSALPEYVLNDCPELDLVGLGEGDEMITDIAESYRNKTKFEDINGIGFMSNGKFVRTPARRRIRKVDEIPWPAWDLVPLKNYFKIKSSHGPYRGKTMPIIASRGCPYDCTFCSNNEMYGRNYFTRDPKCVVDEIVSYIDKYDIKCIDFFDLTMIINKKWIINFCNEDESFLFRRFASSI